MKELDKLFEDRLIAQGNPPMVHTAECEIWGLEHENCIGCQYELGCSKYCAIKLILTRPLIDQNYSYSGEEINNQIEQVMNANSTNDIQSLI